MTKRETETKPATPETGFQINLGEASSGNLPVVAAPESSGNAGGLSYQTARAEEIEQMDKIIASIDLTNPETIISLGSNERQSLADLSDKVLDSIQPGIKLAFAEALRALIDVVKSNSLGEIKKRISDGTLKKAGSAFLNAVLGKDNKVEMSKKQIERFMTDISGTRKTIEETVDRLQDQQKELDKNFQRINALGYEITIAAQSMRVVRAATAEFIRRVNDGEITTLADLQKTAETSGRSDDLERLQLAQANWNNIRTVDGDLLASISVYDMSVANLAFTKQANIQNRIQTASTLTTSVAEWKTQLAIFAVVTTENAAAQLLNAAGELTAQSVKQNKDLFDTLVDSVTQRTAKGTYNLRQIIEAQDAMAGTLESIGSKVEEQFRQLEMDKQSLEQSSAQFRKRAATVYNQNPAVLGGSSAPAPKAPGL